ncbi:unnamed protein product [Urochloa decumbens]|uniref:BHLH domain-containing protein n=1 Tax=Urochloa decumbens TaxID=240449 RepID=A0ABC8X1M0_9POAL
MNQFVPDWNNMGDTSRPLGEDDDLIELLWCNGHVVMQSQNNRKLPPRPEKAAGGAAAAAAAAPAAPAPAAQDDEAGLWFPFALADSLDKDLFSDFFCDAPPPPPAASAAVAPVLETPGVADAGKPCCREDGDVPAEEDDRRVAAACAVPEAPCELMPPPKSTHASGSRNQTMSLVDGGGDNAGDLSDLVRAGSAGKNAAAEAGASSMLSAMGSSICGSNQVLAQRGASAPAGRASGGALPSAMGSANAKRGGGGRGGNEATVASSSGRSNYYCFGGGTTTTTTTTEPTSGSNRSSKRKRLDTTEDSESPSEDAESESAAMLARKPPQKMTTARRSRAAEVHNLSERRRRDRINEKMRALQELIPHCNKTDKASMLDEAIEYLKSLQLQVQMMWMGSGIAAAPPVMFPGVHQYLPRMGVGMGAAAMPSMPRMPPFMAAPQPVVPNAPLSPGYRAHMPAAVGITEPYAHYLGVNHLQPPPSQHFAQGVGYYPMGTKAAAVQQNPALHHVPGGGMPAAAAAPGVLPPESAPSRAPAG